MTARQWAPEMQGASTEGAMPVAFDPMLYMTSAEIRALRDPYVRRPNEHATPSEWVCWAEDVMRETRLARAILDAAADRLG
ncbi:hypothetical protein FHR90_003232 [Endobacter medicaginis]|uniref:Uncharacterized protein n=1 Tax=Endobacter medicaginis TaxID=1181271 RepID=A0A839UZQ2_9PROT|nr:hypothetical protein [Endobacter medicaginis]NVN29410.1 hypothetical protein [Endobacter medicaginis]